MIEDFRMKNNTSKNSTIMRRNVMLALFALMVCCSVPYASADEYRSVGVNEFNEVINKRRVLLIDVRRPSEFVPHHINGAQCLNLYDPEFDSKAQKLSKRHTLAVYCQRGSRSKVAAQRLSDLGYKVVELDGGINAWDSLQMSTLTVDDTTTYFFEVREVSYSGSNGMSNSMFSGSDGGSHYVDGSGRFSLVNGFIQLSCGGASDFFKIPYDHVISADEFDGMITIRYATENDYYVTLEWADYNLRVTISSFTAINKTIYNCRII